MVNEEGEKEFCDHWLDLLDRRCTNGWKEEIILTEPVTIMGGTMHGTYQPGSWKFCRVHFRSFQNARFK